MFIEGRWKLTSIESLGGGSLEELNAKGIAQAKLDKTYKRIPQKQRRTVRRRTKNRKTQFLGVLTTTNIPGIDDCFVFSSSKCFF